LNFDEVRKRAKIKWKALRGKTHIIIGTATCGRAAGAIQTAEAFEREFSYQNIDIPIIKVGCMGLCYAEPIVIISKPDSFKIAYHNITHDLTKRLTEGFILMDDPCLELAMGTFEVDEENGPYIPELPRYEHERRLILKRCGYIDPEDIYQYIATGGYTALEKALEMRPDDIIDEVKKSGLRGRGGAGFPAGLKWEQCYKTRGKVKYVICNGDEGDPGAFMDRVILESDPHEVIEGMIIAGYAIGAQEGYIYVRAEYPLAIERIRNALKEAQDLGILGDDVLGKGFSFHIKIAEGAGAFVSGESTALVSAIEGKRSEPRIRPPEVAEVGLWGNPTLVNNVKTFSYIPFIIGEGGDRFSSIGTEKSKGTAVFTLAGKIQHPGLTEVPMGTTIRTILYDIAGGMRNGKRFKAVQIGGPSGGCIPEDLIDIPIDFDSLEEAGSMMGSGGMIFMDEDDCAVDTARFFLDFTTKESCGKCTMCRIGTIQLLHILDRIATGNAEIEDLELLKNLAEDVKMGSLCGLGKSAPNPIITTLRYFNDEYRAHILEKRCPSLTCKELIAYYIIPERCDRGCEHCKLTCPTEAIIGGKGEIKKIDQEKCVKCGTCMEVCPPEYRAVIKISPIAKVVEIEKKEK
jgi:NADH-quinone oxidoreductase subunit F